MDTEKINVYGESEKCIVVDAAGRGDFTTIQDAVFAAEIGCVILIKNGRYRESVVIDKPLVLKGESLTGVVVTNLSGCVFRLADAGEVVLRNMTLALNAGTGIKIRSSKARCIVTLEDLRISGGGIIGGICGVNVKGSQSIVDIHQCTFNDNISQAIFAHKEARVELFECVVNAVSCIEAKDKNTHISAAKCIFMPWSDGQTRALTVQDYAQCKLVNNEFLGFTKAVHIEQGAIGNIVENVFEDNKVWCIYVSGKGAKAFILNNRFSKNRPGQRLSNLKEKFKIPSEYYIASCIWIQEGGVGEIHNNVFEKNIHCVDVKDDSSRVCLTGNRFEKNRLFLEYTPEVINLVVESQASVDYAVMVRNNGSAQIENNIFVNNGIKQIVVDSMSSDIVRMDSNTFRSNFDNELAE